MTEHAQVMVDQWGHSGEFVRGGFVTREQAGKAGFDFDAAVRVGALRLLTEAEVASLPYTTVLNAEGKPDEDHTRAMRFHAGIPEPGSQRTVTTAAGTAEPAEWAKPTTPPVSGPPPPHAVEIAGSAFEAERAGEYSTATVQTSSGPAFATPEEQKQMRGDEESRRTGRGGRARE